MALLGWHKIATALLVATCGAAHADFSGTVVGIADGDTLTVYDGQIQRKIRLTEIDAPEKRQAFGERSRQALADLCFQKQAIIREWGRDRYGRILGRVRCDGIDVNAEQVRQGMAWVYAKYSTDPSLPHLQEAVKTARHGLWADPSPIPPWEWRQARRRPR